MKSTPVGSAGFDNSRENIDPRIVTKTTLSKQGRVTDAPIVATDITNKNYVDTKDVESFPTSLTAGSIPFSDGSNLAQDNANLFWDATNKRLGIGTATPNVSSKLTVAGRIYAETLLSSGSIFTYDSSTTLLGFYHGDPLDGGVGGLSLKAEFDKDQAMLVVREGTTTGRTGNQLVFCNWNGITKDFDHPNQVNPTFYFQSQENPDTDNTQWLSITHDQTNGVITTGKGDLILSPADNVGIGTATPEQKLHVEGNSLVSSASNTYMYVKSTVGAAFPSYYLATANQIWRWYIETTSRHLILQDTTANKFPFKIYAGVNEDNTLALRNSHIGIGTGLPTIPLDVKTKSGNSDIGGFCIKLTNKTGGVTVQGQIVRVYTTTAVDDAFVVCGLNDTNPIGIVLEAGVADGSEAWIVVSGIADVLCDAGGSGRGDRLITSGNIAGSADVWNVGGAVATHFQEIGHCIETRVGAGLARAVIHFL